MFNQREVFRGAEIRALVPTMCHRRIWWDSFSAHGGTIHELKIIENQCFLCDRAWIFMDFPIQLQLLATLAPSSRRVWECWDTFLLLPAGDLTI